MDRDDVGALVELVGRLDALDAEVAKALRGDELVERDDVHLEGERALGDELADAAEPDHAQRLAVELVAGEPRALPFARHERAVGLGDVAGDGERHRDRVLGRGDRVRLRGVDDEDPALCRGVDVDVVDAGAGTPDHAQAVGALDQLGRHLGAGADQQRVELGDPLGEPVRVELVAELDLEVAPQQLDPRLGDLLGDENSRHVPAGGAGARVALFDRSLTSAHGLGSALGGEDSLRRRDRRAGVGVVAEVAQRHPERGQRDHDVECAEVAAVGDPDDAALEAALPARDGDAVAVAHQLRHPGARRSRRAAPPR